MAKKNPQKIYGLVDLTDEQRSWMKVQQLRGQVIYGRGWRTTPAHHREHPLRGIAMRGYPDCEESMGYWFDNPEKRDATGSILREPIPIHTERDKQFFREQNSKCLKRHGFSRYLILTAKRNFIEEFNPAGDYAKKGIRPEVRNNIGAEETFITSPVVAPIEVVAKKSGRPKGSKNKPKTESRLQRA